LVGVHVAATGASMRNLEHSRPVPHNPRSPDQSRPIVFYNATVGL
jgi:hypothetical protein